jgi:hypothetical protein
MARLRFQKNTPKLTPFDTAPSMALATPRALYWSRITFLPSPPGANKSGLFGLQFGITPDLILGFLSASPLPAFRGLLEFGNIRILPNSPRPFFGSWQADNPPKFQPGAEGSNFWQPH